MNGYRKPAAFTIPVRIADELDKGKGKKQGCKEVKGTILIAGDKEIGTGFLPWQFQVNFIPGSDLFDQLRLEYLKPAAKSDNDTASHRIG